MDRCGEIIATNTSSFVAESFTLHQPPPLGSLVEVQPTAGQATYAVVSFGKNEPGPAGAVSVDDAVVIVE